MLQMMCVFDARDLEYELNGVGLAVKWWSPPIS